MMEFCPDLLEKAAGVDPGKTAMREIASGRSVTYRDLDERASRCATLFLDAGIRAGDRIAILCRNRIEFFEALFACVRIGAILVPLNWRMPPAELVPNIRMAAPALCLAGSEDREVLDTALAQAGSDAAVIALDGPGRDGYQARLSRSAPLEHAGIWPLDRVWYLLLTSGTTGRPKAVIQTGAMSLVNYINLGKAIDLTALDTTLNYLPLFHTAGINLHTLPTLYEGGTVAILPGFDAGHVLDMAGQGAFDTFFGVPAVYQDLVAHPAFRHTDFSAVRSWGCGGAPLSGSIVEACAARGLTLCNGMGMTETGPTLFLMRPEDVARVPGSVGKPPLMSQVRLVDGAGQPVSPGQVGEVQIRGPGITPGYWGDEAATRAAFTADGWLRSGDLARCDDDGFYHIAGRAKEMFISGGENVYPAEIETVLGTHPDILEAAVVAMPDVRWGEAGMAFLEMAPGKRLDTDALSRWCRGRLAPYKVPAVFLPIDQLPRTAAGKVQKHLLPNEPVA